jgi:hypothetical protein
MEMGKVLLGRCRRHLGVKNNVIINRPDSVPRLFIYKKKSYPGGIQLTTKINIASGRFYQLPDSE